MRRDWTGQNNKRQPGRRFVNMGLRLRMGEKAVLNLHFWNRPPTNRPVAEQGSLQSAGRGERGERKGRPTHGDIQYNTTKYVIPMYKNEQMNNAEFKKRKQYIKILHT